MKITAMFLIEIPRNSEIEIIGGCFHVVSALLLDLNENGQLFIIHSDVFPK